MTHDFGILGVGNTKKRDVQPSLSVMERGVSERNVSKCLN